MPKVKIPRKSTHVDMTAFCDVAFLLLSFFMLATQFKPDEATKVETPKSVSSDTIPTKDAFLVTFDKGGRVFITYDDAEKKKALLGKINADKAVGLTDQEIAKLNKAMEAGIGVPFNMLKSLASKEIAEIPKVNQPGIPVTDTLNNELKLWIAELLAVNGGTKPKNVMLKGDNGTNYPTFINVLDAFTKNGIYNFKLITMPENVPGGTYLYDERTSGKKDKK
ncbi:MAG: biopolymer transporter ExbD [Sphingobacteriales bacterium]|nr:MAG: biopolymer transporter ExbD [Sphingobacteriales bacterium]